MNKKERKLALATALQSAAADMLVVDSFEGLAGVSTKGLVAALAAVGIEEVRRCTAAAAPDNTALPLLRGNAAAAWPPAAFGPASAHMRGMCGQADCVPWPHFTSCPRGVGDGLGSTHQHHITHCWTPPPPKHREQGEKVLLIVNEANQNVYLSGRNVPTLAINTAHAVQVRRRRRPLLLVLTWHVQVAWCWCRHAHSCQRSSAGRGCRRGPPALSPTCISVQHPDLPPPYRCVVSQVYDVLNADRIVVEQAGLAYLNEWFGGEQ